jgi:hypothetical protein
VAQIVIDPDQLGSPTTKPAPYMLPQAARKFGYIPDLGRCKPGDLILSFTRQVGFLERQIVRMQTHAGFGPEDARWTHAAVFLYDDFITEAVPIRGVVSRSLYSDIPEAVLRVRRYPNLPEAERYKIALYATRMLGARYSAYAALSAAWKARSGLWDGAWLPVGRTIVCSKVYYDAHAEITRKLLHGCPIAGLVTPAHLRTRPRAIAPGRVLLD